MRAPSSRSHLTNWDTRRTVGAKPRRRWPPPVFCSTSALPPPLASGRSGGEFHTILSFTSDPEKLKTYCRARPWWTRFEEVRNRERFFHWELEYPEVLFDGNPGFDAVLGNPPWDKVLPTKHEFYAHYDALIRAYKGNDLERRLCRCRGADGGADYEHSQKKGS